MEKLLSNGAGYQTVPERFIFPLEKRPGKEVNLSITLPVINLRGGEVNGVDHNEIVQEIMEAGKAFGFFQVVNHGVAEQVINDMIVVSEDFFKMPMEDKAPYYSEDSSKTNRLLASTMYGKDGTFYWRDCLKLACYPVEEVIHEWPEKPSNLKDVLAKFIVEVRGVAMKLLKLICDALGLKEDYFEGDLSGGQVLINANYYAPCPDPSLTLGLPPHCDRNLITLLVQGIVSGLQINHKGSWIGIEPIPNAFVVNFGHQLEIITNGVLKSVEHRAVTNSSVSRTSIATFIMPAMDSLIAPAQPLIDENNPPLYKSFLFKDFLSVYYDVAGKREGVLEAYKIQS
ncbi:2'-deoxymugineic-acid 2'-dioxygenase-like [Typha latifolia]|uniref:2'-deoxymugineic-acid 2'-dioxygenase-like n=1 Tax=Typha latifolia TaxID=4733 RepID=UPI003C2ACA15